MRDHHGEYSNQCKKHADSIPSHAQLSAANRRTARLRRTTRRRRRSHDLILPCWSSRTRDLPRVAHKEKIASIGRTSRAVIASGRLGEYSPDALRRVGVWSALGV